MASLPDLIVTFVQNVKMNAAKFPNDGHRHVWSSLDL